MKRINLLIFTLIFVFTQNTAFAITADSSVNIENTVSNIETSDIFREVRKPTRDKYWEKLLLDTSAHPEILRYRIQWFSGGWSDWYTKGEDDLDWKTNYDGTKRRVWSYFTDHTHEVELVGNNNYLPDLTIENIRLETKSVINKTKSKLLWSKIHGGYSIDENIVFSAGKSVQQTTDGGYIITGRNGDHNGDVYLLKTDAKGNEEWNKLFGGTESDGGHSVRQTTDGGYIILGFTMSYGAGSRDIWLIKTDAKGNEEWNKTFGGNTYDNAYSIQQTTDGGYIITGWTNSYNDPETATDATGPNRDIWLIKTDAKGNEEWNKLFGWGWNEIAHFVQQTTDGGYIIGGSWLIKTDANGNEEWKCAPYRACSVFPHPGANSEFSLGLRWLTSGQQTTDGGLILFGNDADKKNQLKIVKTDIKGNEEWNKIFDYPEEVLFAVKDENYPIFSAKKIQQTTDGGYILLGQSSWSAGFNKLKQAGALLIKTDAKGNEEWKEIFYYSSDAQHYHKFSVAHIFSIQQTTDGNYIIVGDTMAGQVEADKGGIWLFKVGNKDNEVIQAENNILYVYAKIKNKGKKESDSFDVKVSYENKYDTKIIKYEGLKADNYLNEGQHKDWVLLDTLNTKESYNDLVVKVTVDYGDRVLEFKENNNSKIFNNNAINIIEQNEENICPVLKQIKCPLNQKIVKNYDNNSCAIQRCVPISKYYELKQRIKKIKYRPGKREKDIVKKEKNLVKTIDKELTSRLKGKILLQTENNGEAWYVDSDTEKKFYLQDGKSAYAALQAFGLGISKVDLEKISKADSNKIGDKELTDRLKGKILLDVENKGEAWYVDPVSGKRHYMRNGEEAYKIMRNLSLGITNLDLAKISTGSLEEEDLEE